MSAFQYFDTSQPLPEGLVEEELATWDKEMGAARMAAAFRLLGMEGALALAERLGPYELSPALAGQLELEGVALGPGGTVPSLSPATWASALEIPTYSDLRTSVEAQSGELLGLRLDRQEQERLRRFLGRQGAAAPADPWQVVDIARHFFFQVSLKVVVRYTAPRFHQP